jgi:hypothetical protein
MPGICLLNETEVEDYRINRAMPDCRGNRHRHISLVVARQRVAEKKAIWISEKDGLLLQIGGYATDWRRRKSGGAVVMQFITS